MKKAEALKALESVGTAQNRKVYARHGVTGKAFGVSYANLGKLKRKIGVDNALALALWKSGNHDARILACMIADPSEIKAADLDAMVKGVSNYPMADAFAGWASGSKSAEGLGAKWTRSKDEFVSTCGWNVVSRLVEREDVSDDVFAKHLKTIESTIHKSPNRTRYAMNMAVIAIGCRNAKLQKLATAAARRIGKVEVDHGETGCKTPEAVSYIAKVVQHRKKKASKKRARKA